MSTDLIPAATLVLLHQASEKAPFKVLLLQRNQKIDFHGGSWVFPGGKVETGDFQAAGMALDKPVFEHLGVVEQDRVARVSASRETFEEAGIEPATDSMHYLSKWVTPEGLKKRFDARFYLAQADTPEVVVDGREMCDFRWLRPQEALDLQAEGEISLPPPTFVTLVHLSAFSDAEEAMQNLTVEPIEFKPRIVPLGEGFCSVYQDDIAYQDLALDKPGKRHRLLFQKGRFDYCRDET